MSGSDSNTSNVLDNLGGQDAHRVREVSVMVSKDGPLTEDKLHEIRRAVARHAKKRDYPNSLLAQKWGTNETYVSNFLSGRFDQVPAATLQKLARTANEWLELDHRRKVQQRELVFVPTKVAARLIKVARHAVETVDIVVAHGPAGCGKSVTLRELQKLIPASMYIHLITDHRRRGGFLRALYEVVWQHRAPARPTLSQVIERLKFSDRLLMLDNADVLEREVYQVLMDLHDVAGIPILLCGTHRLLEKLTHDNDPLRGQMSSRIGMRAELLAEQTAPRRSGRSAEWISSGEIRAMFERGRVKLHPSAVARLKAIANYEIGRLRRCERMVRYAQLLGHKRSGEVLISEELLEQAIVLVDGEALPAVRGERPEVVEATA